MKQNLIDMSQTIDRSTITCGEFNTPFSVIDRQSVKGIELNYTVNQLNPIAFYTTLHLTAAKYIFFSSAMEYRQR